MFLQRYQLTAEQQAAISGDINLEFFAGLDRVKLIHGRCKGLTGVVL